MGRVPDRRYRRHCVLHGWRAVSTSFVNMVELGVTMSGLLLAVPFAIHALGGWGHMHALVLAQKAAAAAPESMFNIVGAGSKQVMAWIAILVPSFMISPGLVQKMYGARDVKTVQLGWAQLAGAGDLCLRSAHPGTVRVCSPAASC